MNKLVVAGLVVLACFALSSAIRTSHAEHVNHDLEKASLIKYVNSHAKTWTASANKFQFWNDQQIQKILGYRVNKEARSHASQTIPQLRQPRPFPSSLALPSTFDARIQWPNCIHPIRDQGDCGSCWAFGATESLTDRFCISSNASTNVILSVQETTSCTDLGTEGCNGGDPVSAFTYTSTEGLPIDSCVPYTSGTTGDTGSCYSQCVNPKQPYAPSYYSDLSTIRWHDSVEAIQQDIYQYGPVEACFSVYADFMVYQSGVYVHTSGGYEGGHCIKLLGWGTLNGMDYWLAANSWGTSWGMNGYFMIQRGTDMCFIESAVFSVLPDLSKK